MKKKRQPVMGINLVERAVLLNQWNNFARSGQIHVLIGEWAPHLVNYAGRMVYVALGCALTALISADDVDVRILRGAAGALYDQVGQDEIANRQALLSGVEAALRVGKRVGSKALVNEIVRMEIRLRTEHLNYSDFEAMFAESLDCQTV